jgi:hypothetical protein
MHFNKMLNKTVKESFSDNLKRLGQELREMQEM